MSNINIPNSWVWGKLEDFLDYVQPTKYIVESTDYDDAYTTPVLTAGKSFILGYTNEKHNIFQELPVIIFDDFTTAIKFVKFPFKVKSSAMKILVPTHKDVSIKYVYYFMETLKLNADTHKRYWISVGSKHTIPVPPLAEQHRIVTKIEELFSELDKGIEMLQTARQQLKVYRQAVLKWAFEGRLNKRNERSNELSENWVRVELITLSKLINGDRGKNYPNRNEYITNGIPFINTGHIEPSGKLDLSSMNYISRKKFDTLNSGKVIAGDLIYCLRGATMGKTAIIDQFDEGAIASSLVIIRVNNKIFNKFLYYYLISPQGKDLIKLYDNGTAQPNLSAKSLSKFEVPLPSFKIQVDLVSEIELKFSICDKMEEIINLGLHEAKALRQSILKKAFSGKLVFQNPQDEPASLLLERIWTNRAELGSLQIKRSKTSAL